MISFAEIDVEPRHLEMVTEILERYLPDREVWAYGSRVSGRSWQYSDLDLVVMGDQPMNLGQREDMLDDLSETRLPYLVDLKDWSLIPQHWRDEIRRCYAVIHSPKPTPTIDVIQAAPEA